ncbi:MAG: hypothetical protein ACYTAN_12960 [Planctomycetota bacterium]|jgi:hypothetical protein
MDGDVKTRGWRWGGKRCLVVDIVIVAFVGLVIYYLLYPASMYTWDWKEMPVEEALAELTEAAGRPIEIEIIEGRAVRTVIGGTRYVRIMRFLVSRKDVFTFARAFNLKREHGPVMYARDIYPVGPVRSHRDELMPEWFTEWDSEDPRMQWDEVNVVASGEKSDRIYFIGTPAEGDRIMLYIRNEVPGGAPTTQGHFHADFEDPGETAQ